MCIFNEITKIMKCSIAALILALICFSTNLFAQTAASNTEYYTFELSSDSYTTYDTSKMISISGGVVWAEDTIFTIPIGFRFRFLDHDLTELHLNQVNLFMPQRNYFIVPFGSFLIEDRANNHLKNAQPDTVSESPISYFVDSSLGTGSRILKIQWNNADFFFDSTKVLYLNLQIWLYEGSNNIEIRYGKSNVNLKLSQVFSCGPLVGLAKLDTNVEQYEFDLDGNPLAPIIKTLQDTGKRCLSGVPPEGTIYRFLFHDSAKVNGPPVFSIYPVPTQGKLYFKLIETGLTYVTINDMLGRPVVDHIKLQENNLDISDLRNGMYYVTVTQGERRDNQKIILTRY